MDVAAFVGFAASGPVDVPVAIEDAVRFRDVFGADVELARDGTSGRTQGGRLGAALEAFLRNGGRRCHVVRVADPATIATACFAIGGLLCAPDGAAHPALWRLASLDARSGGDWASALRVSALLRSSPLVARPGTLGEGAIGLAAAQEVVPGDLLRVTPSSAQASLMAVAATVTRESAGPSVTFAAQVLVTPVRLGDDELTGAFRIGPDARMPVDVRVSGGDLLVPTAASIRPGDMLELVRPDGALVAQVGDPRPARPGDPAAATRMAVAGAWRLGGDAPGRDAGTPLVERLSLDLLVWRDDAIVARIGDLGLAAGHPRYWRDLPCDEQLFRALANLPGGPPGASGVTTAPRLEAALWSEALQPRFPLAAARQDGAWLPLGVPLAARAEDARGPVAWRRRGGAAGSADRLERDGLALFGPELFVDAALADCGADRLDEQARDLAFLARRPHKLRGIHALYPVREVALIAVPDAGHRGWLRTSVERPPILGAPVLSARAQRLTWTAVAGAASYRLEEADEPTFTAPSVLAQGPALGADAGQDPCSGRRWFRVRAVNGPWSNSVTLLGGAGFDRCRRAPEAVTLAVASEDVDGALLEWTAAGRLRYELERSTLPDFDVVDDALLLDRTRVRIALNRDVAHHVRVRAVSPSAGPGPWSNTAIVAPLPRDVWTLAPPDGDDPTGDLLAIQRALLRLCAARSERAFAILAFPAEAREAEAAAHVAALLPPRRVTDEPRDHNRGRGGVRPLDAGEAHVLGYGALYHPWVTESGGGDLRLVPPDGAITGLIAARTIARGAWIAPANEALVAVVGLDPERAGVDPAALAGTLVNPLVADPRGVVPAGARTLSLDGEVAPIGVRRLLTLLRRLVLRDGAPLVFEPGSPQLRGRVVRHVEAILAGMHARGAFAGATAAQAYRVRADDALNPPAQVDAGRFVAEIQVAPSQPLAFISVRLVLDDAGAATLADGR